MIPLFVGPRLFGHRYTLKPGVARGMICRRIHLGEYHEVGLMHLRPGGVGCWPLHFVHFGF